jgi:diacylglycerol kinase (ATP)
MRRAALFYNPHSGQRRGRAAVERVAAVLRAVGIDTTITATLSGAEAGRQAGDAVARGCDTIFACGGDGTILDVVQGLVGTDAALAIIPLGTANVLAHDLGVPRDVIGAARAALHAVPVRVGTGRIECRNSEGSLVTRYFLSVAGAGRDGYIIQALGAGEKRTLGLAAYFLKALRVWLVHHPQWFSASVAAGPPQPVTQLLAVRLHNFGNLLRDLAPGASLLRQDFRIVLFQSASRWSYLRYVLQGVIGAKGLIPHIEIRSTDRIQLTPSGPDPVYLEADGELLGQLPAEITLVPNALTLLVPPDFASRQPG